MNRFNSSLTRQILLIFSVVTALTLNGCQTLPPTSLKPSPSPQDKKLYALGVKQTLAKAQWLISETALQQALLQVPQQEDHYFFTPYALRHYQAEQQTLSSRLIEYAKNAVASGDMNTASRCYTLLRQFQPNETTTAFISSLKKTLSTTKSNSQVSQQQKLGKQLDQSIQEGQLIESSQLIAQLTQLKRLSKTVIRKVDKANGVLSHNAELLDEQADLFYRDGNIRLANSLWEYLLKFDPDNTAISNKLSRSAIVITNMQELRDKSRSQNNNTPNP